MDVSGFQSSSYSDYLGRRAVISQDVVTAEGVTLSRGEEVLISDVGSALSVITKSGVVVIGVPVSHVDIIGSPFEWDRLVWGVMLKEYSTSGTSDIADMCNDLAHKERLASAFHDGWGSACVHLLTWRPAYSDSHFELSERPQAVLLKCSHPDIDGVFIVSGWATRDSASGVRYEFSAGVVADCTILGWRPDYE